MTPFLRYYFDPKGEPWWQGAVWGNILASAVLSVGILFTLYKTRLKCSSCYRPAHHKVANTHFRTCHVHTNAKDHIRLQAQHRADYPEEHAFLKSKSKRA